MNRSPIGILVLLLSIGSLCEPTVAGGRWSPTPTPIFHEGKIFILGHGVECKEVPLPGLAPDRAGSKEPASTSAEVCNTTWIDVEIKEFFVSVKARKNSTASTVAADLAARIAAYPELSSVVRVEASENVVHVRATLPGVRQRYPWSASCSYIKEFFDECAFRPELSPIATLMPRPPNEDTN